MTKIFQLAMTTAMAAGLMLPMFAQAPAPAAAPAKTTTKAAKTPAVPAPTAADITDAKSKGLVWVNLSSKVYHTDGKYYGATKSGKFMTKADADKAGYKAAKESAPKAAKTTDKK